MPRTPLLAVATMAAVLIPTLVCAQTDGPILSGHYLYTDIALCWNGTPPVLSTKQSNGTVTFDRSSGKMKQTLSVIDGPHLTVTGFSTVTSYALDVKYLTIGDARYRIFFGASQDGVATSATFSGITPDNSCSIQGTLSQK